MDTKGYFTIYVYVVVIAIVSCLHFVSVRNGKCNALNCTKPNIWTFAPWAFLRSSTLGKMNRIKTFPHKYSWKLNLTKYSKSYSLDHPIFKLIMNINHHRVHKYRKDQLLEANKRPILPPHTQSLCAIHCKCISCKKLRN